jgi:hypothetical protein
MWYSGKKLDDLRMEGINRDGESSGWSERCSMTRESCTPMRRSRHYAGCDSIKVASSIHDSFLLQVS